MIFEIKPLKPKNFLQRIFQQEPDENSVIELNNLLASNEIKTIKLESLHSIEVKYNLKIQKEFRLNLEEFYLTYFNYCLTDKFKISDSSDLDHLQKLFGFGNKEIVALTKRLGISLYKRNFEKRLALGKEAIEHNLKTLSETTHLDEQIIKKIRQDSFSVFVKDFIAEVILKNRFSSDNEIYLNDLSRIIGLPLNIDKTTIKKLSRAKFLWELENKEFPIINVDISLQKNEVCHFYFARVAWYEMRSNRGVKTPKHLYDGNLFLTNKRILFEGDGKSTSIKLQVITGVHLYNDCVEIRKDTGRSPLLKLNDLEIFSIIITRLLNQIE